MIFSTLLSAQDEAASNILTKLSNTHKLYNNITVAFDLNYENQNLNIKEKQSGTLVISGDNFLVDIDNQIIINNGEVQWIYLADMNEVQVINHEAENEMMNPKNFFKIHERISKYRYIGLKSEDKKRLHIIELFPEESSMFMKVELTVNSEDLTVVESIPGWAHDITNIGSDELIVMLWANEIFDPLKPDTYSMELKR